MTSSKKALLFCCICLFFASCSDNAIVRKNDKELSKVNCMRLVVFPPDRLLSDTAKKLYHFEDNCSYTLSISKKSGITCNSNYNVDKKVLSSFPSGYIRLDLTKNGDTIFSYYKDLTRKADKDDVEDAFEILKKSLKR